MISTLLGLFRGQEKKKSFNDSSLFVSSYEFGHLLDENVGSKFHSIDLNSMANRYNPSFKQLWWETEHQLG